MSVILKNGTTIGTGQHFTARCLVKSGGIRAKSELQGRWAGDNGLIREDSVVSRDNSENQTLEIDRNGGRLVAVNRSESRVQTADERNILLVTAHCRVVEGEADVLTNSGCVGAAVGELRGLCQSRNVKSGVSLERQ